VEQDLSVCLEDNDIDDWSGWNDDAGNGDAGLNGSTSDVGDRIAIEPALASRRLPLILPAESVRPGCTCVSIEETRS
jgi:hypothetical protein